MNGWLGGKETNKDWFQLLNQDVPEGHWLPHDCPYPATPLRTHQQLTSNTWKKKFQLLPLTHSCSHKCPQARAAFLTADYKETFTPKINNWRETTYTDGSVIKHKADNSPPLSGSGVYKPGRDTSPPSQHLQLHVKYNGLGHTNTITRAELVGILVHSNKGKPILPRIVHPSFPRFQSKLSIRCA
eukprot:1151830-Pelagomonas_calceolata.AAC.1